MPYLPDTNVWINHLNPAPSVIKTKLSSHAPAQIVLCDVVKAELYYGCDSKLRAVTMPLLPIARKDKSVKDAP